MVHLANESTQKLLYIIELQQNELVLLIPGVILLENTELLKSLCEIFELSRKIRST